MTVPSWTSLGAWQSAARASIRAGRRPVTATICRGCLRPLPRIPEGRELGIPLCACGPISNPYDEYETHGLEPFAVPRGLEVTDGA